MQCLWHWNWSLLPGPRRSSVVDQYDIFSRRSSVVDSTTEWRRLISLWDTLSITWKTLLLPLLPFPLSSPPSAPSRGEAWNVARRAFSIIRFSCHYHECNVWPLALTTTFFSGGLTRNNDCNHDLLLHQILFEEPPSRKKSGGRPDGWKTPYAKESLRRKESWSNHRLCVKRQLVE